MTFRNLDLSSLEQPENGEELPEPRLFDTAEQAFRYYLELYQKPTVEPMPPWLAVPDATRLIERLLGQFQKDWPQIHPLMSEAEQQKCLQICYHVKGLRQGWQFASDALGDEESEEGNLLREGRVLRDQLLGLALTTYADKPKVFAKIDEIRAMSRPNNSLYDEFSEDLKATVNMFETNKFVEVEGVEYPTQKLKEATQIADQLPLFSPKASASEPSSSEKPKPEDAPITHRTFGVLMAALYQLSSWGRHLHFPSKEAHQLYPLRIPTTSPQPPV